MNRYRRGHRAAGKRLRRATGLLAVAAALAGGVVGATAVAAGARSHLPAAQRLRLSGTVSHAVSVARDLGALQRSRQIRLALPLRLPNAAALNTYVSALYTPGSRLYHRFLSPARFGARFGAPAPEVRRAVAALRRLGLNVAAPADNHLYLSATASVATVQRTFAVRMERFGLASGRTFYANADDIELPAALRGLVTGVLGLDGSPRPVSHLRRSLGLARRAAPPAGVHGGATPCRQAAASGGYTAPDLAQAYDYNGMYARGFHGEGMRAALVEFDDYHDSNVRGMESCYGIRTPVTRRPVDGGVGGPPEGGEDEDMADITTLLELDPRLSHLYVYEAPITGGGAIFDEGTAELDLYNAYVTDDKAPVLSVSWGYCEELQSASYDQLFGRIDEEAAAQGQQIFGASGDSGAVDCLGSKAPTLGSISVEQEPAVPWETGVGGTDLGQLATTRGSHVHHEATWNDSGAGGGGQSNVWTMPSWQAAYLKATHHKVSGAANDCRAPAGTLCRMVPDIAMNADPDEGGALDGRTPVQFSNSVPPDVGSPGDDTYCATSNCSLTGASTRGGPGAWYALGGTSLAAPTAAAAAVLWDQEAKAAGLGRSGFLNPSLYRIASSRQSYARDFHDVTSDTNDDQYDRADCPRGCNPHHLYSATQGYDLASGLGSVDVANLGADLVSESEKIELTPATAAVFGYLHGPSTTQPVSVTSGFRHTRYKATSDVSWLHVRRTGKVPGSLSWRVTPRGLSSGARTGHITVTGRGGSTATLTVTYRVGPRARISVSPGGLHFAEAAVNSRGAPTKPKCGSTHWNDQLRGQVGVSSRTPVDQRSRRRLLIKNRGRPDSTLHYEASFHTYTGSWLTEDLNPHNKPGAFQTHPAPPFVPTAGALRARGRPAALRLASIANANRAGEYPSMDQGTYRGVVVIRDLADPRTRVRVPVSLVLGNGKRTPRITATPHSISVRLARGQTKRLRLRLSDSARRCGYSYSLEVTRPWVTINPYLRSGTVKAHPARSAPSAHDTGRGNGFTPLTISARGLANGHYRATVIVDSQDAVHNPTRVPIRLTVGGRAGHRGRALQGRDSSPGRAPGFTG